MGWHAGGTHLTSPFFSLQVRFKDKTPNPLDQLDTLLQESYNQLSEFEFSHLVSKKTQTHRRFILLAVAQGEEMEKAESALKAVSASLSCATNLMLVLMR